MNLSDIPKLVINLPERTDRLTQVQKELAGWEYTIIPGVINQIPKGIAQAHLNCIQRAKDNNWEQVLIMEDDVVLRKGAVTHLDLAFGSPPEDWDILLGGCYENKSLTHFNQYWDKVGEFCGLHFYIVKKKAYESILSYDLNNNQHIDRWMNQKGQRLNCYVLKKFVATQREGFSDNVKKGVNYSHLIPANRLL